VLTRVDLSPQIETSSAVLLAAADLSVDDNLSIWDEIILAASAAAGSEDMQDGFTWNRVTVANPARGTNF
jgi:predicted nucleic acid-binding protein